MGAEFDFKRQINYLNRLTRLLEEFYRTRQMTKELREALDIVTDGNYDLFDHLERLLQELEPRWVNRFHTQN